MSDEPQNTPSARILICEDGTILAKETDLTLRNLGYELTGQGLEERVMIDPEASVLKTGLSPDAHTKEMLGARFRGFAAKPFDMKDLLQSGRQFFGREKPKLN